MKIKILCSVCGRSISAHWYRDEHIQDMENFINTMLSGSEPEDGIVADTYLEPRLECECDKPTLTAEGIEYLMGSGVEIKDISPLVKNKITEYVRNEEV